MFTPVILPPHSSPTRPPSDLVTVMPVSDPPLIVPVLPTLPIVPPEIVPEPLLPPVPGSSTAVSVPVNVPMFTPVIVPDRKSTRLHSSHTVTSYAVFGLQKIVPVLPTLPIVPPHIVPS